MQFNSPAEIIKIDIDDNRLDVSKKFGATKTVNNRDGKASEKVIAMTKRGMDVAIVFHAEPCISYLIFFGTLCNSFKNTNHDFLFLLI